jgi:putative transposase
MNPNPSHHRRSIRLPGYDYSQPGAYFITLCTRDRECLFGEIVDGEMVLNEFGYIVADEWHNTSLIRAEIELGDFFIMPNHIHAILWINTSNRPSDDSCRGDRPVAPTSDSSSLRGPAPRSVGAWVGGFKSAVTKSINALRNTPGSPVWQRNYWEHIIRDEKSYDQIMDYIQSNPTGWQTDTLYHIR